MRSSLASRLNRAARLRATSAHRGGRRFEGLVDGQDSQRSTSRSAAVSGGCRRRPAAFAQAASHGAKEVSTVNRQAEPG